MSFVKYYPGFRKGTGLSLHAYVVLMLLDDMQGKKGKCWPKIEVLADELGISKSSVKRAVEELLDQGFLKRSRRAFGRSNEYAVLKHHQWAHPEPTVGSQRADSGLTESHASGLTESPQNQTQGTIPMNHPTGGGGFPPSGGGTEEGPKGPPDPTLIEAQDRCGFAVQCMGRSSDWRRDILASSTGPGVDALHAEWKEHRLAYLESVKLVPAWNDDLDRMWQEIGTGVREGRIASFTKIMLHRVKHYASRVPEPA